MFSKNHKWRRLEPEPTDEDILSNKNETFCEFKKEQYKELSKKFENKWLKTYFSKKFSEVCLQIVKDNLILEKKRCVDLKGKIDEVTGDMCKIMNGWLNDHYNENDDSILVNFVLSQTFIEEFDEYFRKESLLEELKIQSSVSRANISAYESQKIFIGLKTKHEDLKVSQLSQNDIETIAEIKHNNKDISISTPNPIDVNAPSSNYYINVLKKQEEERLLVIKMMNDGKKSNPSSATEATKKREEFAKDLVSKIQMHHSEKKKFELGNNSSKNGEKEGNFPLKNIYEIN
jgi:hypothetical protein